MNFKLTCLKIQITKTLHYCCEIMSLRCMKLLQSIRNASLLRHSAYSTLPVVEQEKKMKLKEYRTEDNLLYFEDPDTFGTLSRKLNRDKIVLEDEGDIQEEKHGKIIPMPFQQLTTKQYADIIKQYLGHKRLKEAINVLEVRMLKEDRVKPENYIYNILIGACADVGYTKKAFSLYNDMKKRALKVTGDTYTCLFHACSNSPFALDGLKKATNLRALMSEKGVEPNLTNYNAMIKAFGRCGDLATAFQIVDEMVSKDIPIRIHTFNHLLQACISDKENGLRHALLVWRKMLKMREKPNIYSFNLMLKCVKECNMGSKKDIEEMIEVIQDQIAIESKQSNLKLEQSKIPIAASSNRELIMDNKTNRQVTNKFDSLSNVKPLPRKNDDQYINKIEPENELDMLDSPSSPDSTDSKAEKFNKLAVINNDMSVQVVKLIKPVEVRKIPNLLSKKLQLQQVLSLQKVETVQEKFAVVGSQDDFLKEMKECSVAPDIKTFTQMLSLIDETEEAETKLLEAMKAMDLKADIDFYNMLIKKRCLRSDYNTAFAVRELIEKESKRRKRKYPLKKKLKLEPNIMTYGVLAMACRTKESAEKMLNEMKEEKIKVNSEILGTLLRQGTINCDFGYVLYIMKVVKKENGPINHILLKHLEDFKEKCSKIVKSKPREKGDIFLETYRIFSKTYADWLKEINVEDALKPEHPWAQFKNTYPETVQRQSFQVKEPKKFYRRSRKYIKYVPTVE